MGTTNANSEKTEDYKQKVATTRRSYNQHKRQRHRHISLDTRIEPQATKKLQENGLQDHIQE